jgi:hypothetical protein
MRKCFEGRKEGVKIGKSGKKGKREGNLSVSFFHPMESAL